MNTRFNDFLRSECELVIPVAVFRHIFTRTNGDPCTTGCCYFNNGNCPTYKKLKIHNPASRNKHIVLRHTNYEIAKELGVSKRQVSKMRKDGSLPAQYQ